VGHNVLLLHLYIRIQSQTINEVCFSIMRRATAVLLISLLTPMVFASEVAIEHSGLTLNGNLELSGDGDMSDGIVLILHGTLGHNGMEIISTLQEVLIENERNSLAVNLSLNVDDRHGFFPCDSQHSHKMDDASDELSAWVSWLASEGANDIVILGHSRGGNQVARFIVDRQPDLRAAILIAPSVAAENTDVGNEEAIALATTSEWMEGVEFLHCSDTTVSGSSYLSYYGPVNRIDTPALLKEIEIPVMVFSGSEDTVVPDLALRMKTSNQENVAFEEIDGAGHFFRDLYLYDVVDSTLAFLEGVE
jgi:dienelactone hydrolase